MNDPENFLARWSRRKREGDSGDVARESDAPVSPSPAELEAEMSALAAPENATPGKDAPPSAKAPAPAFDPASLPSLDSIGPDTDIRGFLKPGVPTELAHAALRRVWVADPGIRDFKGLAEYDWDFTAPNSMLGFGELDPGTDVPRMLADVFGEKLPDLSAPAELDEDAIPGLPAEEPPTPLESLTSEWQHAPDEASPVRVSAVMDERNASRDPLCDDENAAMQNEKSEGEDDRQVVRRQHGGALPQ